MKVLWSRQAAKDREYWKVTDTKMHDKITALITNIIETPYTGIGKPEPLRFQLSGWWSRRINIHHRLIYRIRNENIEVLSCRFHYEK